MPGPFDHPQRAAFAAHSWLIPRLLSRFKDPLVARQGHTGWTTRSAGRVRNGRFLAQGRRSASSLRTPRGLTTPARIRSIPLCGNVDAAGIRMPLHRLAGTIRRNKHRDDRAHGRLQNPLAQNDVRAGEPSRRWEARWNKWKGHPGNYGIHLDYIAHAQESLGSALARVCNVLEEDDRHLAATLAGQHEGEDIRMREERVARLLNDPEKLRELRQQRAERKAGQQQSKGRYWSMRM